jgi:hypothetical protein
MQRSVSRFAAGAAVVLATAVAGCGPSASAPNPIPVSAVTNEHKPAPPHLPAHHAADALFVLDLSDQAAVQPATVDFESNGRLERMRWSHWGAPVTNGHGTLALRDCTPSCVGGHTVDYPVTVTLSHPASCFGAHFYGDSVVVAETSRGRQRLPSFIRNPC